MLKRVILIFFALGLITISCRALDRELEYLGSAKALLLQAQEFNKSPELAEAIRSIDSAQLRASAVPKDDAWNLSLLSVLVPFFAGCLALAFGGKRSRSASKQSPRENVVRDLMHLVTDPSVPDEVILEMRAKARRLR